jgi:ribosomal protein S18 acetylase RimI-like enzyme
MIEHVIEHVYEVDDELVEAFRYLIPQLTTNQPPSLAQLRALVAFPGSVLLIARESNAGPVVGSATLCMVYAPSGVHARLEDVIVDGSLRGRGIGEALTKEVLRLARESGADYVALTSNPRREAANKLYQKLGFNRWETNVYRHDLH